MSRQVEMWKVEYNLSTGMTTTTNFPRGAPPTFTDDDKDLLPSPDEIRNVYAPSSIAANFVIPDPAAAPVAASGATVPAAAARPVDVSIGEEFECPNEDAEMSKFDLGSVLPPQMVDGTAGEKTSSETK